MCHTEYKLPSSPLTCSTNQSWAETILEPGRSQRCFLPSLENLQKEKKKVGNKVQLSYLFCVSEGKRIWNVFLPRRQWGFLPLWVQSEVWELHYRWGTPFFYPPTPNASLTSLKFLQIGKWCLWSDLDSRPFWIISCILGKSMVSKHFIFLCGHYCKPSNCRTF